MANIDFNTPFNPITPSYLRSAKGSEIPHIPYRCLAGSVYPSQEDLSDFLDGDTDGVSIAEACPIVRRPEQQQQREVVYCRTITLPARRRDAHVVVWAPTGAGKSTRVMQPLMLSDLADPNRVVVSLSLKAEEYPLLAAASARSGIPVQYIDLGDPARSLGFNPLATEDPGVAYDVISTFAGLVVNRESRESEFWKLSGMNFMAAAWHCGCRTFAEILDLFELPREAMLARLRDHGHPSARSTYSFINSGSQNADTTLATLIGWLAPFRDLKVRATTSCHELDTNTLFRKRGILAVRCPEPRLSTLRPVYNILLQYLLDHAVQIADEDEEGSDRPSVSFFVEDLPAWGPITNLLDRLTTLRSRRISLTVAIQSMAHLRHTYGASAEAVEKSFVNKIILPGIDQNDAEYFCRYSGEQQVVLQEDHGSVMDRNMTARYVLSPSDIRAPRWKHFLLGHPATFIFQDVMFQSYLVPTYMQGETGLASSEKKEARPPVREEPLQGPVSVIEPVRPSVVTDTRGMSDEKIKGLIKDVKKGNLDWENTTGSARKWWEAFESENSHRPALVLRLAEELAIRKATITEFFLAYVSSNTDNIQANLHYLDYLRLKKTEQANKQEEQRTRRRKSDS